MLFQLSGIGYTALGLFLFSLSPLFARSGARRLAPALGALAFSLALIPGSLFLSLQAASPAPLVGPGLFRALGAGLALALCLLFFFRAAAVGQVLHALPLTRRSFLFSAVSAILLSPESFTLFTAVYLLLFLLGILLMVAGQGRYKDRGFLVYSLLSGIFFGIFSWLRQDLSFSSSGLVILLICCGLLFALCFLGGAFRSRIQPENLLFALAGGSAAGVAALACHYANSLGIFLLAESITVLSLPLSLLLSRLFLRERATGLYGLGLLLVLGGMAAFLLQTV